MIVRIAKSIIEYYWKKTPASQRRVCIHRISCSRAVYDSLSSFGFWRGVKTYIARRNSCNAHYIISASIDGVFIKTKNGVILSESEINPILVKEFNAGRN
jgi:putative component of membrane protein insertase Oxa1/YidC/SpoIIIJ protein YidD